jgi:hypothetical protein
VNEPLLTLGLSILATGLFGIYKSKPKLMCPECGHSIGKHGENEWLDNPFERREDKSSYGCRLEIKTNSEGKDGYLRPGTALCFCKISKGMIRLNQHKIKKPKILTPTQLVIAKHSKLNREKAPG